MSRPHCQICDLPVCAVGAEDPCAGCCACRLESGCLQLIELHELVDRFRKASANLRRQNANTFQIAVNTHSANAFFANTAELTAVHRRLIELDRDDLATALYTVHRLTPRLRELQDANDWMARGVVVGELKAARTTVRQALRGES